MNWIQTTLVQMVWIQTGSEKSDKRGNGARDFFQLGKLRDLLLSEKVNINQTNKRFAFQWKVTTLWSIDRLVQQIISFTCLGQTPDSAQLHLNMLLNLSQLAIK